MHSQDTEKQPKQNVIKRSAKRLRTALSELFYGDDSKPKQRVTNKYQDKEHNYYFKKFRKKSLKLTEPRSVKKARRRATNNSRRNNRRS